MQELIELFEMVSLNYFALRGNERTAIRKARRALRVFERSMESFKTISAEEPNASEGSLRMAA